MPTGVSDERQPHRGVRHVGINALFLEERMGGVETYVRRLIPSLLDRRPDLRVSLFVSLRGVEALRAEAWWQDVCVVRHALLGRPGTRAITELTLLGRLATQAGIDLLHSVAMIGPLRMRPASVLTIHDVIWNRDPDPDAVGTVRLWRLVVPLVARRADRIITVSEAARSEIIDDLGVVPERVDVIRHGPGFEPMGTPTPEVEIRTRLAAPDADVVLAVSALKAHKNVGALIDAMPLVRRSHPNAILVVPANPTPLQQELEARARALGVAEAIRFPGWLPAADLEALYVIASCFVFPSLREGFGLPLLEAMRRGLPVACSRTSALPEVAGDAALYFDPERPEEIASCIVRLLEDRDLAAGMAAAGLERQRAFSWTRAAEATLASYERACQWKADRLTVPRRERP